MKLLGLKRIPLATFWLTFITIFVYFLFSSGTLYIESDSLYSLAYTPSQPLSILTHLFVHVGIFHFIGNIIPLIIFALVLESAVIYLDVLLIFFISGAISALIFSGLNPSVLLIGGSAGIAGVMSSALLTRPRHTLVLLIITTILMYQVIFPVVTYLSTSQETQLAETTQQLSKEVIQIEENLQVAVEENRTEDAAQLNETLVQTNTSFQETKQKLETTFEGKERESKTPIDFPVHVYGAIIGALYIIIFRREKLKEGKNEFIKLGEQINDVFGLFKHKKRSIRRKRRW